MHTLSNQNFRISQAWHKHKINIDHVRQVMALLWSAYDVTSARSLNLAMTTFPVWPILCPDHTCRETTPVTWPHLQRVWRHLQVTQNTASGPSACMQSQQQWLTALPQERLARDQPKVPEKWTGTGSGSSWLAWPCTRRSATLPWWVTARSPRKEQGVSRRTQRDTYAMSNLSFGRVQASQQGTRQVCMRVRRTGRLGDMWQNFASSWWIFL